MTIETHTTDRKALAQQISELLSAPVAYAGAPSFAYRVGDAVAIDRDGNLEVTGDVPEALRAFLTEQGWMQPEPETPVEGVTISVAVKDITVVDLKKTDAHALQQAVPAEPFHGRGAAADSKAAG